MKITGDIKFKYRSEKDAEMVYDSLEIDNEGFLDSDLHEKEINYNITSDTPGSFLATADDLIASEIVCEKIIENSKK